MFEPLFHGEHGSSGQAKVTKLVVFRAVAGRRLAWLRLLPGADSERQAVNRK